LKILKFLQRVKKSTGARNDSVKCTKKRAGFEQKSAARDNMDDKAGVLYEDKCNVQDKAEAQARRIAGGKFFILVHARPCRQAQGLCPI
jgi:hypothetical protein